MVMICTNKSRVNFLKIQQISNFRRWPKLPYGFIKQEEDHQVFTNGLYYLILKGSYQFQDKDIYYHGEPYNQVFSINRGKKTADLNVLTKEEFRYLPEYTYRLRVIEGFDCINVKDLYSFLCAVQPVCGNEAFKKICCLATEYREYIFDADTLTASLKLAFHDVETIQLEFKEHFVKIASKENDNVAYCLRILMGKEREKKDTSYARFII